MITQGERPHKGPHTLTKSDSTHSMYLHLSSKIAAECHLFQFRGHFDSVNLPNIFHLLKFYHLTRLQAESYDLSLWLKLLFTWVGFIFCASPWPQNSCRVADDMLPELVDLILPVAKLSQKSSHLQQPKPNIQSYQKMKVQCLDWYIG